MSQTNAYDEATKVTPVDGEVVLEGPDGVAVSMTPGAAKKTAKRLQAGAEAAEKQDTNASNDS